MRLLVDTGLSATIAAAKACYPFIGKKDNIAADKAATESMREKLANKYEILGTIVIGEGERDQAPMLYRGEILGKGGLEIDIAVDPLEGTNCCAAGIDGAVTVMALAPKGGIISANDIYMNKIATAIKLPLETLDLSFSVEKNLDNLSSVLQIPISDIGVSVLNRPRHQELIVALNKLKAKVNLIEDGDIAAIIQTRHHQENGLHLYMGIGGAPEGVLAAAALKTLGGFLQGQFVKHQTVIADPDIDFNKKYHINDMITQDVVFVMTAVTNGLLPGIVIKTYGNHSTVVTNSLILNSFEKCISEVKSEFLD